ncbi:MAG: hypothetical protein R3330_04405 [Saprospiraceae bacterium]|nr:hypothetical protein [Saprospiraceae bacterium]
MMRLGHLLFAFALTAALVLNQGCYYDQVLPEPDPEPIDTVSFSMDVIPIFNMSCNTSSCHGAGAVAPDLSPANAYQALSTGGYINVTEPELSELYQWMRGNRDIPMPITGPNSEYNGIVLAWIKQGALDN